MDKHVNISNAKSKDEMEALEKIAKGDFCPFCQPDYIKNEHGKPILKDGKFWFATENRWPYAGSSNHLVFIHKKHHVSLLDLSTDEWIELKEMVSNLVNELKIPGATFLMRFGDNKYTGGTVTHLHAQLVSGDPEKGEKVLARVG